VERAEKVDFFTKKEDWSPTTILLSGDLSGRRREDLKEGVPDETRSIPRNLPRPMRLSRLRRMLCLLAAHGKSGHVRSRNRLDGCGDTQDVRKSECGWLTHARQNRRDG